MQKRTDGLLSLRCEARKERRKKREKREKREEREEKKKRRKKKFAPKVAPSGAKHAKVAEGGPLG
jgi:hypothetical protein